MKYDISFINCNLARRIWIHILDVYWILGSARFDFLLYTTYRIKLSQTEWSGELDKPDLLQDLIQNRTDIGSTSLSRRSVGFNTETELRPICKTVPESSTVFAPI